MSGSADSTNRSKESIVEQILEQGQRLRNAMVKAILDADPSYTDESVVINRYKKQVDETIAGDNLNIKYHIHGTGDLCNKYKDNVLHHHKCKSSHCNNCTRHQHVKNSTQKKVEEQRLCDLPADDITRSIQDNYRSKSILYFKYVNSLKITLFTLKLNQAGNRKVNATSIDPIYKLPTSLRHNYLVEYMLPATLVNVQKRNQSKVDSGLNTGNRFRVCSKRLEDEEIHLKHTSIHDIENLLNLDLKAIDIVFQVSCRTIKQKNTNIIGCGSFNLSLFEVTKNLSYSQDIPIIDSEGFCYGVLKLSLQLGCGRMYFGKEFVDFVSTNILSNAESLHFNSSVSASNTPIDTERSTKGDKPHKGTDGSSNRENITARTPQGIKLSPTTSSTNQTVITTNKLSKHSNKTPDSEKKLYSGVNCKLTDDLLNSGTDTSKELLLFGLIYISEAQYFRKLTNTYFTCQVFCQGDTLCSRIVYNSKQPIFNFYQKVPLLLDDALLWCFRDNFIKVDFWERCDDEDVNFGTTQLSLHQYYTSYKNPTIVAKIFNNKLPVTTSDWWEPIFSVVDGDLCGQVKILVALGNATQIENLEIERGIRELHHQVKYVPLTSESKKVVVEKPSEVSKTAGLFRRPNYLKSNTNSTKINKIDNKKVDVAVQSDLEDMESNNKDSPSVQNILDTFLEQIQQQQKVKNNYVENATNTDTIPELKEKDSNKSLNVAAESLNKLSECRTATNMHLQKTSDLLDYLNDALSGDSKSVCNQAAVVPTVRDTKTFKAHVVVESALHLPTRRNHRSRKTKKRNTEVLPSPYVTFETVSPADLKITPIVQRSCNPNWNYSCDVLLPTELLNNNQKRLIFKVWSKSGNSLQPNPQTDIIIGFAALDLTVLVSGLPSVQGWFNIIDFTSKCNGQIKIDVVPLNNVRNFNTVQFPTITSKSQCSLQNESESEPTELLSRALKRKFTQLDEITQRLRARLADVTKDDSDLSNDGFSDEFERDINTACIENDRDMIDLSSNSSRSSATVLETKSKQDTSSNRYISAADRELLEGKQRINMLLEKLTLLSNNEVENSSFSNRYVSGCSLQQNNEELFVKQMDIPTTFSQLHLTDIDSIPSLTELSDITKSNDSNVSSSSLSVRCPVYRCAPDGAGNSIDDDSGNS